MARLLRSVVQWLFRSALASGCAEQPGGCEQHAAAPLSGSALASGDTMTRRASKRTTLKDKYKIQRKIKQHKAKQAKLQKLKAGRKSKLKKDP